MFDLGQLTGPDTSRLWEGIWGLQKSLFCRDPLEKEVGSFRVVVEWGPQTHWPAGIVLKCVCSDDGI